VQKFPLLILLLLGALPATSDQLVYKDRLLPLLVEKADRLLETYDPETGRFGTGIWICRDQEALYPLAVLYSTPGENNPYYKKAELLEKIVRGGEALIAEADEEGRWIFRKKDGSEWGMIRMPWTYSRWVRAFSLIKEDMAPDKRENWEKALALGYENIREKDLGRVHNIPAHHAMGLYIAGQTLGREEFKETASEFLMKVAEEQTSGGYWSENVGPVVNYNFVYVDALGTYYAASGDQRVLEALRLCALYHSHFTYPDGTDVETIDERNPYHDRVQPGNVGFTLTPEGRAYLKRQWEVLGEEKLSDDLLASLLVYGEEGEAADLFGEDAQRLFLLEEADRERAAIYREGPWFICLSAYTAPLPESRWIQDRQNLVSIHHRDKGLLVGGGNTKLQPAWSSFTVGDPKLLKQTPGETDPDFKPTGELYHIPSEATLVHENELGLDLRYGPEECQIRLEVKGDNELLYHVRSTLDSSLTVHAHLTLLPDLKIPLKLGSGVVFPLDSSMALDFSSGMIGKWLEHRGARYEIPLQTSLIWPALPFNPYRKEGQATQEEARISLRIPLNQYAADKTVRIQVTP
jgi:hypothetical protein